MPRNQADVTSPQRRGRVTPTERTRKSFTNALDGLIAKVRTDRSILAAILCGSLSHDVVWEKSDIDLALVTIDDKKTDTAGLSLYAGGFNVHAFLMPRSQFRKTVEGTVRNSFMHSLLGKGRLLYSHDPTIETLFARLSETGERDRQVQMLSAATHALTQLYKAHKWFITRRDLEYTALWILYAATPLARIEVIGAGLHADREVILQAMKLNPGFFKTIYVDLLNMKKKEVSIRAALEATDAYLAQRAAVLFGPLLDYLRDAGEARSCTEIEADFKRHFGLEGVTTACEYLADQGVIHKVSIPVQLTKMSNVVVEELAFIELGAPPDEF